VGEYMTSWRRPASSPSSIELTKTVTPVKLGPFVIKTWPSLVTHLGQSAFRCGALAKSRRMNFDVEDVGESFFGQGSRGTPFVRQGLKIGTQRAAAPRGFE